MVTVFPQFRGEKQPINLAKNRIFVTTSFFFTGGGGMIVEFPSSIISFLKPEAL